MNRILCFLLCLLLAAPSLQAQRVFGLNDSTTHIVAGTDTVVAGRYQLYRVQQGQLLPFADFYDPADPDQFIRDFDSWNSLHFYVVLGSRYIGNPTLPLRSFNAGLSWQPDSALMTACVQTFSPECSLNALQTYGDSTMYAFDGYYQTDLLVSHDRGQSWQNWFHSLQVHYFQFLICPNGRHFLMSMPGDIFGGHLTPLPDSLLDYNYHLVTIGFATRLLVLNSNIQYVEPYFLPKLDSLCNVLLSQPAIPALPQALACYPNPSTGNFTLALPSDAAPAEALEVYDARGVLVYRQKSLHSKGTLSLAGFPPGFYWLRVFTSTRVYTASLALQP